jgi:hypothetical protein
MFGFRHNEKNYMGTMEKSLANLPSSLLAVSAFFLDWSPKSATHRNPGRHHHSDHQQQQDA